MNPYLKNTLVILGALAVGMIVNGGIVSIADSIIPYPEGVDPNDVESIKANIDNYSPRHFIMPFLAHALGTFAGAFVAARYVTKAPAFWGFMVGVVFLLGGISMVNLVGGPIWFILVDLILAYLPFAMIANVFARKREVTGKLKHIAFVTLMVAVCGILLSLENKTQSVFSPYITRDNFEPDKMSVEDVLVLLNDEKPVHYLEKADPDSARMGEELVKYGRLKDKSNKLISKYFVCTDCHNLVLETDDPRDESPERVLKYSKEKGIPFLPASTFYSMYNKRHWYNGDYAKKYGDLVKPSRDTLYNAIQLCATQCSQGREMDYWEIRCVVHYYKTLELKLTDLVFETNEIGQLSTWVKKNPRKAKNLLKTKYNEINSAHFGNSEIPKIEGYQPKIENGEYIYKDGCLHCHAVERGITNFDLGMDKLSFKFLAAKKEKYNSYSISHITRYGTYAISGRKQYMPQYTFENMSDEQMLDLIFFIETKANE